MNCDEVNLTLLVMAAIHEMNFEILTDIQEKAILKVQKGVDPIGCILTGTGRISNCNSKSYFFDFNIVMKWFKVI